MAVLDILEFPDPRLRTRAAPVETVTDATRALIDDMFATMYAAPGIGLAATQVNVHQRLLVIDISSDRSDPLVFINPEVTILDPVLGEYDEGCLSVPGFYETVERPQRISVTALDRNGEPFTRELGVCWRSACNTRSTTSTANCSWITCPPSSASVSAGSWRKNSGARPEWWPVTRCA